MFIFVFRSFSRIWLGFGFFSLSSQKNDLLAALPAKCSPDLWTGAGFEPASWLSHYDDLNEKWIVGENQLANKKPLVLSGFALNAKFCVLNDYLFFMRPYAKKCSLCVTGAYFASGGLLIV